MAWEIIKPSRGQHPGKRGPRVTFAFRKVASKGRNAGVVGIGKTLLAELGWQKGMRVEIARDREIGLIRVAPGSADDYRGNWGGACLAVTVDLEGLSCEPRPAEPVEWRLEDGAVIVTLPAWARPEKPAQPPEPVQAPAPRQVPSKRPDPAPRPAAPVSDKTAWNEAENLLAAGMSARQVADDLDLPLGKVSAIALRMREQRNGSAA